MPPELILAWLAGLSDLLALVALSRALDMAGLVLAGVLHVLACSLLLAAAWGETAGQGRALRRRHSLLWLLAGAVLPLLAATGFVLSRLLLYRLLRVERAHCFRVLPAPVYQGTGEPAPGLRLADRRDHLLGSSMPTATRMRALLSLQHTDTRYSAAVLQGLLRDDSDDLRLLAYGMLNQREKGLTARIDAALAHQRALGAGASVRARHAAARELAELYWEMLYQNLAQGEVYRIAVEQVKHHAVVALQQNGCDAGLWIMMGRTRLLQGDEDGALADFSSAIALGVPATRIAPFLAELAFLQRDFKSLHKHLRSLRDENLVEPLHQLVAFWTP
jgi:hypothetical protein